MRQILWSMLFVLVVGNAFAQEVPPPMDVPKPPMAEEKTPPSAEPPVAPMEEPESKTTPVVEPSVPAAKPTVRIKFAPKLSFSVALPATPRVEPAPEPPEPTTFESSDGFNLSAPGKNYQFWSHVKATGPKASAMANESVNQFKPKLASLYDATRVSVEKEPSPVPEPTPAIAPKPCCDPCKRRK